MEKEVFDDNCVKMQAKVTGIVKGMLAKLESSTSPLEYLVTLKKFDGMMGDMGASFAALANVEFETLSQASGEEPVISCGATIKAAKESYNYTYPTHVDILDKLVKNLKEEARADGTAKKGERRSKRDFTISL